MFNHSTAVTGNDYYGAGTDTCAITSCETGYTAGTQNSQPACIANTITVRWGDKDGGVHATNQCTYGGTLTTPTTAPAAPRGHHFTGWVFPTTPTYDFTPLINTDGNSYGYKSADGSGSSDADGLENGEWKVIWDSYGTAKGTSMCSSDGMGYSGGETIPGTPASTEGGSCWCKMTGWTPNGGTETPAASLWVFAYTYSLASACASSCASYCGNFVRIIPYLRSGLFGSVQQ
jgi:hypothetical protein